MASIVGECQAVASSSLACVERAKAQCCQIHTQKHTCACTCSLNSSLFLMVGDGVSDKLPPNCSSKRNPLYVHYMYTLYVCILLSSGETSELHTCFLIILILF